MSTRTRPQSLLPRPLALVTHCVSLVLDLQALRSVNLNGCSKLSDDIFRTLRGETHIKYVCVCFINRSSSNNVCVCVCILRMLCVCVCVCVCMYQDVSMWKS